MMLSIVVVVDVVVVLPLVRKYLLLYQLLDKIKYFNFFKSLRRFNNVLSNFVLFTDTQQNVTCPNKLSRYFFHSSGSTASDGGLLILIL